MSVDHRNRCMTLFQILFLFILLAVGHGTGLTQDQAQPQNPLSGKNVLVLHAFESNVPIFELTDRGLRAALDGGGVGIRNQFFEYFDLARNPGPEYRKHLVELMRLRYSQRKIDAIITLYPEALQFALNEGQTIFSEAPIIALYLPSGPGQPDPGRRVIQHPVMLDFAGTLEIALKLVPRVRRVYVVSGVHPLDRSLEDRARNRFKAWDGRLEIRYLSGLSMEEILATVSSTPADSIVFVIALTNDVTGRIFTIKEVCQELNRVSNAPVFGLLDVLLGHGIVGGSLLSYEYTGTRAGELALDILKGTRAPENIPPVLAVPSVPMFDWRQIRRWSLDEDDLPEGSIVINREKTLWDFKYHLIGSLALMIGQSILIAGLTVQRRRRRLAEEALKERLNFEMLMAEISALFVNLPADRIDSEIEAAQHRVCEFLDLDRSSLFQTDEGDPETLLLTHLYQPSGSRIPPERMSLKELFPWVLPKVLGGETITISKMTDLPAEAGCDRETFGLYGTRSVVAAPLAVGRRGVFGLLTFAVMREEREWTETIVKDFQLIAQVFANALVRKSTEESLRQKTEELDQFFSVTLDLLCIANNDGYFLRLNPAWERILGYSREELMEKRFFDFVHIVDLAATREAVFKLAEQQEVIHFENRYRCKDGSYRWLEWTAAPAGEMIYAAARDITERLKAEAEARQRRDELAHVARITTIGELTASLAHEINQPLAAILSNAEAAQRFLSRDVPDISELRQILDDIIADDRRASEVVQKVRSLVRKEKPLQEFLDLNKAIQEVVDLIRGESLLQGLSIRMELSPDLKRIRGDRIQLQQVILNLVLNGAAAMKNSPWAQRKIIVKTAMPDNGTVKASVTDFGTGIDEETIERLFEPFYTTKSDGLGVGLSISQGIITAHGGSLKAFNNPEGGATFAFMLPAHQGDAL